MLKRLEATIPSDSLDLFKVKEKEGRLQDIPDLPYLLWREARIKVECPPKRKPVFSKCGEIKMCLKKRKQLLEPAKKHPFLGAPKESSVIGTSSTPTPLENASSWSSR